MIKEDRSYGVIVLYEKKFLILKQTRGHWGFPKGHLEGNETEKEAALRELKEEAGIIDPILYNIPPFFEEYVFEDREIPCHKVVQYFVGFVRKDNVTIQEEEILEYKWATYEQALETLTYDNNKEVLKKVKEYLDKI